MLFDLKLWHRSTMTLGYQCGKFQLKIRKSDFARNAVTIGKNLVKVQFLHAEATWAARIRWVIPNFLWATSWI
jgi:hypothetical protein